jgi:hypothetical protein
MQILKLQYVKAKTSFARVDFFFFRFSVRTFRDMKSGILIGFRFKGRSHESNIIRPIGGIANLQTHARSFANLYQGISSDATTPTAIIVFSIRNPTRE